jgi:GTP-binding protein HflX
VVALVGYTNAGKTTLFNRLTREARMAADQLFVTLDPAARLVEGDGHVPFILTDTVGFIRKLPHQLVAAFKATLEELAEADVLVHVVDASHPALDEHVAAVEEILEELEVGDRPIVVALNKVDRVEPDRALERLVDGLDGVALSARTGEGVDHLLARLDRALRPKIERARLCLPYAAGTALSLCYDRGRVLDRRDEPDGIHLVVEASPNVLGKLSRYRV